MSTDLRWQSRVLAEHALSRSIRERLVLLEVDLTPILESVAPTVRRDVLDTLLVLLSHDHLTVEQRTALLAPLQGHMAAALQPEGARRALEVVS